MKKCLIIVDPQNDFMTNGALAVPNAEEIIPVINNLLPKFELIIFTKDWHPENHKSFASQHKNKKPFDIIELNGLEQVLWPDHCINNEKGSEFHDDIDFNRINGKFYIFKKGMDPEVDSYSGFYDNGRKYSTGLADFLKEKGVEETYLVGLALDFCLEYTAIDSAMEGFETVVIKDGTRPLNSDISNTLNKFREAGVKMIESWELNMYNATK